MRLKPKYFFLQFSSLCNSRCVTCHLWQTLPITLPVEMFKRVDLFIDPSDLRSCFFTGGEPLLPINCVEMAVALNQWRPGIAVVAATNALKPDLYMGRVRQMQDAGVSLHISVSLNGLPSTHDWSRGVDGNYAKAVERAEDLKEAGCLASINILFIPGVTSGQDLEHCMSVAKNLGVPCWSSPILRHNPWFGEDDDGFTIPPFDCHGGGEVLTIRPNGDITACQEDRPQLIFANLRDEGLDEEKALRIQDIIRKRECQPCGCCTNAFTEGARCIA